MNKEKYNQVIDKVYNNYLNKAKNYTTEDLFYNKISGVGDIIEGILESHNRDFRPYTQEEFINKIKTDDEFSETWGLKIEERELSLEERTAWFRQSRYVKLNEILKFKSIGELDKVVPRRLITITNNKETIEIYE